MITPQTYVPFLVKEYLRGFVADGGAAVKFVVPQTGYDFASVVSPLREAALADGYVVVQVDARSAKVHMMDKLFHEVARQIDWRGLADVIARRAIAAAGFQLPDGDQPLDLERIAKSNDYAVNYLNVAFNKELQRDILHDYSLTQDFRHAMIALCRAQADRGAEVQTLAASVLDWLNGDLQRITQLRDALIFQRIGRHNARDLLFSLASWVVKAGRGGLVLVIDASQLAVSKRSEAEGSLFYTRPAVLDAYELLRQLIDEVDELSGCLVVVGCAPEFLTEPGRGLEAYHALRLRIADDVRDRRRPNPFAALVRLGVDFAPDDGRNS